MSRKLTGLIVGLAAALSISACAPAATPTPEPTTVPTIEPTIVPTAAPTVEPSPAPIELTDGLGHKVTLSAPAQRIISIAPSNTEILFAIGAGAQVIGREELSDYPAEAKNVASIGSVYGKLNTEAIVALKPDLILAAEINPTEQVQTLQDLGLTVYYLNNPQDFAGLFENLKTVGALTGHAADAQKLVESLQARYAAVIQKVATSSVLPKVFYEVDATDPTKPYTAGSGTFIDTMITLAGGHNIGQVLKDPYGQLSAEELVKQNPDVIILGDSLYGVTVEAVGQRAGWASIAAVKNKAVYTFDDNLVSRPGPRLVDGLEQLAKLLHPDLFN
jgi:iron complex transport system substrate-binding protein